jgi:ADP-ribose pyrophosphatase YjhB (NUDIX family)
MPWGKIATGILPIAEDTCRVMVQKRSTLVDPDEEGKRGTWGIVGGAIGEWGSFLSINDFDKLSPKKKLALLEKTNKTELSEEIGVTPDLKDLEVFYEFKTPNDTFRYYNMVGFTPHEFTPTKKSWETDEIKWLTLKELMDLPSIHSGFKKALQSVITDQESKVHQKLMQCQKQKAKK